jgi:hypothetical protein
MIPQSNELTLNKLAKDGLVSTDNCNTACKTQRLLCELIKKLCFEKGLTEDKVDVLENDCWNHLQNVWFGPVVKEITSHLDQLLKNDLDVIHPILRVTTDPNSIFCAIERFLERLPTMQRDLDLCTMIICARTIPMHIIIKSFMHLEGQGKTLVLRDQWLCL